MKFGDRMEHRRLAEIAARLSATDPHLRRAFDRFNAQHRPRVRTGRIGSARPRTNSMSGLLLSLLFVLLGVGLVLLAAVYHTPPVVVVGAACAVIGSIVLLMSVTRLVPRIG